MRVIRQALLGLVAAFFVHCEIGPETDPGDDLPTFPLTETAWISGDATSGLLISSNLEIHGLSCWNNEVTLDEVVGYAEVDENMFVIDTGARFNFDTDGSVLVLSNENGPLTEYAGGRLGMDCPILGEWP